MRSIAVAAGFGLASALSVIVLGDESGYTAGEVQQVKLATIEAEWHTEKAPASITAFGFPNEETQSTDYAIKIPYLLGLIATRSVDKQITGIKDLQAEAKRRIGNGMIAYAMLEKLRGGDKSRTVRKRFADTKGDLGYGLLLKKYTPNVSMPRQSRSGWRRRTRSRASRRCSGRSASWWGSGFSSCSSSPPRSTSWRSATCADRAGC